MGHVAIVIDDDLHARARALHHPHRHDITWAQWVEAAIAEAVERQEAERAEEDRKRRR